MTLFARRAALPESTSYSVVDEQLVIRGEINTQGTIRIDGRLEGRQHRADTVIVGTTGAIVGDLEVRELVVAGTIEGCVVADVRVEVHATGCVRGDIRAPVMVLHEGGRLLGHLAVDRQQVTDATPRLELARKRSKPALPG